jgi:8-oxo-dGTP pyrophosphatase MutT (NUDIX family)
MPTLAELMPHSAEVGVGLALRDDAGRFLFFLAGTRHHCPQGELFYAGIGGHREEGEDWAACAHREAQEEVGVDVELLPALATWHVSHDGIPGGSTLSTGPDPWRCTRWCTRPVRRVPVSCTGS